MSEETPKWLRDLQPSRQWRELSARARRMMRSGDHGHLWVESSGTTHTCEWCRLTRYSVDGRGRLISNHRAVSFLFGRAGEPARPGEPGDCSYWTERGAGP